MNYLKVVFFLLILLTSYLVKAQTELELKTTGRYLCSWAFENSEAAAKETAKLGLMDTIFVSLLKEPAVDQTDTVFIKAIHYFVNKVGVKWQVIAFAEKSDVKVKLEQRKQLKVIPVIVTDSSDASVKNSNKIKVTEKPLTLIKDVSNSGKIELTGNQVLDELLLLRDAVSLEQQLVKYKYELKLNYGDKSNYPNDTGCYVFVIDKETLKILAVFDKGTISRQNLLTNTLENNIIEKYKGSHFVYVAIN